MTVVGGTLSNLSAKLGDGTAANPYRYTAPGEHGKFDLYTLGADAAEGGEGEDQDVKSWE